MKTVPIRELETGMVVRPVSMQNAAFVDCIVLAVEHSGDGTGRVRFSRPHSKPDEMYKALGFASNGYSRCEDYDAHYGKWASTRELYLVLSTM